MLNKEGDDSVNVIGQKLLCSTTKPWYYKNYRTRHKCVS